MDAKKLIIRSLSGIVYVAVIVGCILWGVIPFSWMAAAFGAIAVVEFEKITRERSLPCSLTLPGRYVLLSLGCSIRSLYGSLSCFAA